MGYYPINVKSGYTFFASSLKPADLVSYALNQQNDTVCLTDHNGMFGVLELATKAKKKNLHSVVGMEIGLQEGESEYPLVLLAKNELGYQSLTRLTKIVSCDDFSKTLTYDELLGKLEGLIVIVPAVRSELYQIYLSNQAEVPAALARLQKLGADVVLGLECYQPSEQAYLDYCRQLPIAKCIANEVTYGEPADCGILDVLSAIKMNTTLENKDTFHNQALNNDKYLAQVFSKDELKLNEELLHQIDFDVFAKKAHLINYPLQRTDVTKTEYLRALCMKGLAKRLNNQVSDTYVKRLDYELGVIDRMEYTNYFLVVWDYVKYAKQHGILVGPGRGSGAGALTAYVLGITDVDPIKYGLLFERFLNPERVSMPDLDVDFIDNKRDEVVRYLFEKYSADHVAIVVAFQTFQVRQAMHDAAKVLGLGNDEINMISKRIPDHINGSTVPLSLQKCYDVPTFKDFIDGRRIYQEVYRLACQLEGLPRSVSQHAAGVVLSDEVLSDVAPVYHYGEVYVTQYSKNYVEDVGLLKMDILALTDLAVLDATCRNVEALTHEKIVLNKIDFDDPEIYKMINLGTVSGIFQISSPGMRKAIRTVKPTCFDDLVAILALFRPGPLDFIPEYGKCKNEHQKIDYIDECLKDILMPTYGIIVYQEQIMEVLSKFAGFSLGESDMVRRAISKKSAAAMESFKNDFMTKAKSRGHNQATCERVYELIAKFANYGFNKSHSVSYAMITAMMTYLKAHYPAAFYCACMDRYNGKSNESVFYGLIGEMQRLNISVLPPSINKSSDHFIWEKDGVRFSLQNVKSISNVSLKAIVEEQQKAPFQDFFDFMARVYKKGVDISQVNNLIDAGCFDEFGLSRTTLRKGLQDVILYLDISTTTSAGGLLAIDVSKEKIKLTEYPDDPTEKMERELAVLGSYFTGYAFENDRAKLKSHGYLTLREARQANGIVKVVAYARGVRTIKTKKGEMMAVLTGVDKSGQLNIVVFPDVYRQVSHLLQHGNSYYFEGTIQDRRDQGPSLIVSRVAVYKENKEVAA